MIRSDRAWDSRTYKLSPRAGGCFVACIGILIIVIGAVLEWNTLQFLPGAISTTGTIISCNIAPANAPVTQEVGCTPLVSFQTQKGQHMTLKGSERSTSYFVGETVSILYHPDNPQDARLAPSMTWLVFVVFGLLFLLLGLFFYVYRWKSKA